MYFTIVCIINAIYYYHYQYYYYDNDDYCDFIRKLWDTLTQAASYSVPHWMDIRNTLALYFMHVMMVHTTMAY